MLSAYKQAIALSEWADMQIHTAGECAVCRDRTENGKRLTICDIFIRMYFDCIEWNWLFA